MIENISEILSSDNQLKTRSKKPTQKIKEYDEHIKHHIKLSKLSLLEEDEFEKEDKEDSDYEMNDEDVGNADKKKRATRTKATRISKELRFGKINVSKYFIYETENISTEYPNYNNIIVKPKQGIKKPMYKICDVCFGFGNYTCKLCKDRYCSKECFKAHKETKCVKYIDV